MVANLTQCSVLCFFHLTIYLGDCLCQYRKSLCTFFFFFGSYIAFLNQKGPNFNQSLFRIISTVHLFEQCCKKQTWTFFPCFAWVQFRLQDKFLEMRISDDGWQILLLKRSLCCRWRMSWKAKTQELCMTPLFIPYQSPSPIYPSCIIALNLAICMGYPWLLPRHRALPLSNHSS